MSEPSQLPAIATSPISVLLVARRGTPTDAAIQAWRHYLGTLGRTFEIMLIQENRPDPAPADDPALRAFGFDAAQGFGHALNDAIAAAQHPLLAFSTADQQYQPADLERMLKIIDKVHLVIGYRDLGTPPPWRVLLDIFFSIGRLVLGIPTERRKCWLGSHGRGRRWLARWIFGLRVSDPECPFRLARRSLFERIPIQSAGAFAWIEMLAKANHLGALFAEEPVAWTPTTPIADATFSSDVLRVLRSPEFRPSQQARR